jgi:hypothetical protein
LAASLIAVLATAVWIYFLKGAADDAALKAIAAQRDAEQASELAQTRVLEGQLAHTRTEAELLGILQQFEKYKAYRDTLRQWQEEFRTRATTLEASANERLPMCNVRARFSVYERQLIKARLEDLGKDEALFAYLAVIPGSSPRLGDWAPAVLDVFFAPSNVVSVGRNLERGAIKRIMETVPIESRAGFLVGLGTPLVLTHAGKNYRIRMTNIAMNDDGDMAMSFELCVEGGA